MIKGKVILVPFPFTDLAGQKVRPALVLHASKGEDCIVAFISSRKPGKKHAFEVPVAASRRNDLKQDSLIKCDKIATLQKKIVLGELGTLEREIMSATEDTLRKILGI